MHQYVPCPYEAEVIFVILSIEIKYVEQDGVCERADRRFSSVTLFCATNSQYSLEVPRVC